MKKGMPNYPNTIREALDNLADIEASYCAWGTLEPCFFASNWMGSSNYDEFERRFKRHWVVSWICTDTQVGISIITLDGKPVAISYQSARKNDEEIRFVSPETYAEVFSVMNSLANKWEDRQMFVNLDEEIDQSWYERAQEATNGR